MKVLNSIGSKERFVEIFQGVNKGIKLNEAFGQGLNPNSVLEDSFNQLKTGNLKIEHSNTQSSGNENYVELICLDRQNNNITFTFRVVTTQGDQDGVFNVESATLTQFGFDDADGENTVNMDEGALKQFNAAHASEISSIADEYVDVEEPVDIDMDEQYRTAIERIDAVPYAKGTETMVKHSEYADEKPTNPDLRAGDAFNKFVKEEMDDMFNPEDIESGFQQHDSPESDEPLVDPDTIQPSQEEVPEETKRIILQAYDNLVERAKQQRKFDYSPTQLEVEDEILRITGKKVVKEKTRVFPKEAEPWLEEEIAVDDIAQKTLTPEKKAEYIQKAKDFIEGSLGAQMFYGMMPEERNKLIAEYANRIFMAEMAAGNYGVSMNEEESSDYPDPIGKKFKPKSSYPKKKKKPQSVTRIDETEGEKLIKQHYSALNADMDYNKLATAYQNLLKLKRNEFRGTGVVQTALASLRDAITGYLNQVRGLKVSNEDVQNYFENMLTKYSSVAEGEEEEELTMHVPQGEMDGANDPTNDGMSLEPAGDEIEQIAQEKEAAGGDMIPGGKADGKSPLEYPADQVKMGLDVEKEHTDDPLVAVEIATDHLEEFPDYYTRLDAMEKEAKAESGEGEEENEHPLADVMNTEVGDKETTDELLGYKPMNVGETIEGGYDFAAAERNYADQDAYQKYLEYTQKDLNNLSDDEKEEYFELWKQFKGAEKVNETPSKHVVVFDGSSAYVEDENNVPDGVEIVGRYDNIDDAQEFADKYNDSAYAITEQKIKLAKQALNKRGLLSEGMTKKEAVQILIKHNIK